MAEKSSFLRLTLPGNNEYTNTWDGPNNGNFLLIDEWAEGIENELQESRGSTASLPAFLAVSFNADGTPKANEEMVRSRNSKVYGDQVGSADALLYQHLESLDFEIYRAREGAESLQASLARRARDFDYPDSAISGASLNGQPNFLAVSDNLFQISASSKPVVLNIDGYFYRIRKGTDVEASGSGTKRYLVASKPDEPTVLLDRSTQEGGTISQNGDNQDKLQLFVDSSITDFTDPDMNVGVGDTLEVLNSDSAGKYIIADIIDANTLLIYGSFPLSGSGLNYKIYDHLEPKLEAVESIGWEEGKCYIGEATWDAGSEQLSNVSTYAFKGKYESEWRAVTAGSPGSPVPLEETFYHNLGKVPRKITILASQSGDDGFVEMLSVGDVEDTIDLSLTDTTTFNAGGLQYTPSTYSDVDATPDNYAPEIVNYVAPSFTGGFTGGKTGSVVSKRSIKAQFNKLQIDLANIVAGLFYKDFGGNDRSAGSLKVICEK